jgi:hypothetical protein
MMDGPPTDSDRCEGAGAGAVVLAGSRVLAPGRAVAVVVIVTMPVALEDEVARSEGGMK